MADGFMHRKPGAPDDLQFKWVAFAATIVSLIMMTGVFVAGLNPLMALLALFIGWLAAFGGILVHWIVKP